MDNVTGIDLQASLLARRREIEADIEGLTQWLVDHHDASIDAVRHVREKRMMLQEELELINKQYGND